MELRQLEYFLAVVEHGTLTKAAAALHLAQPSLSQMIKTLERDLGTQLFHRVGRRLVLSPAGHVLIDPARVVLRDAATARATVAEVRGLTGGRLDLASLSTLAVDPLAPLVGAFRRTFPRVAIGLLEPEDAGAVGALVSNGVCELGVGHLPTGTGELVEHDLGEQELFVVLPPDTPHVSAPGKTPPPSSPSSSPADHPQDTEGPDGAAPYSAACGAQTPAQDTRSAGVGNCWHRAAARIGVLVTVLSPAAMAAGAWAVLGVLE